MNFKIDTPYNNLKICAVKENVQEQKRYFNEGWNRLICA